MNQAQRKKHDRLAARADKCAALGAWDVAGHYYRLAAQAANPMAARQQEDALEALRDMLVGVEL